MSGGGVSAQESMMDELTEHELGVNFDRLIIFLSARWGSFLFPSMATKCQSQTIARGHSPGPAGHCGHDLSSFDWEKGEIEEFSGKVDIYAPPGKGFVLQYFVIFHRFHKNFSTILLENHYVMSFQ